MTKIDMNCCVRLPADVHRQAKHKAYKDGMTLQDFITKLILEAIKNDKT